MKFKAGGACSFTWPVVVVLLLATAVLARQPNNLAAPGKSGTIADIQHVVLFMQENRAFDHYFGTMAGVRGFADPNVQVNDPPPPSPLHVDDARGGNGNNNDKKAKSSVWYQVVNATFSNATDALLPWHLNHAGGAWLAATQCMVAGDNGWQDNHGALHGGRNDHWVLANTPWSWGYYKRADLPLHFALAEGWTVGDMYQESVIASTNPNRVSWVSGSINAPGSPQRQGTSPASSTDAMGGMTIDNNETPGCEAPGLNCYPLRWTTAPELYEAAGVSWQVYQDADNFDDNPLAWFQQFQDSPNGSALSDRGMAYVGLDRFYADAAAGTLPMVSYVIGPAELSEHPPYSPRDGAWLQQQVVNAVTRSPRYDATVLIVSYDETGGFGDHVTPYHAPEGTAAEWVRDPYDEAGGHVYTGPGFRLPFYIISPWTRGANVFTERADHTSQIQFIEAWLRALGYENTTTMTDQIPAWRREHMSDLVAAFDFAHPDTSLPEGGLPTAEPPHKDAQGRYDGSAYCEALYAEQRPPVPYGRQTVADALFTEQGFKRVRGNLTEGRYLVFEKDGRAIARSRRGVGWARASGAHEAKEQRWIAHYVGTPSNMNNEFALSSAVDGRFVAAGGNMVDGFESAATVTVTRTAGGYDVVVPGLGRINGVAIYSVTYRD